MYQINNEEFANSFYTMLQSILTELKCVGKWSWGNPQGTNEGLKTYELFSEKHNKSIWVTLTEWTGSDGVINRKGIMATLPATQKKSLGQIVEVTIPFEYKKIYNTRAFTDRDRIEIRNYGRFTVGRAGLKRQEFFDYVKTLKEDIIFFDEEGKQYVKVLEYSKKIDVDKLAEQLVDFTLLIDTFKQQYRSINR